MSTKTLPNEKGTADDRPDDCICAAGDDLPCWACYRAGHETANPDGDGRDD